MRMPWLPIMASIAQTAESVIFFFLNMVAKHNTVLFGLKLDWGFRHLWRCSNKNNRRYQSNYIDVIVTRWLGSFKIHVQASEKSQNRHMRTQTFTGFSTNEHSSDARLCNNVQIFQQISCFVCISTITIAENSGCWFRNVNKWVILDIQYIVGGFNK